MAINTWNGLVDIKSLIAPKLIDIHKDYIRIGDTYQRLLLVEGLPELFGFGLFCSALNSEANLKYYYVTRPMRENMSRSLSAEVKRKNEEIRRERSDHVKRERLRLEVDNLQTTIEDIAASSNIALDLMIVLVVYARSLQELEDRATAITTRLETTYKFKIANLQFLQDVIFKTVVPFWKKTELTKDLNYRYRVPLSTRSTVMLWPYFYEDVRDPDGLLMGYTLPSRGLCIFNPFLWEDNPEIARPLGITAGSTAFFGMTGAGKTTALTKLANLCLRKQIRLIWFDPNNQNYRYIIKNKGRYISFGTKNNIINVLELKRVGDGNENSLVDPYDTALAKAECIRDFKEIVKLYNPNNLKEVEKALNIIDEIIYEVYDDFNITASNFKNYKSTDYPIIEDVLKKIRKQIEERRNANYHDDVKLAQLNNLDLFITPLCMADGQYFNGHTTLDFNNSDDMLFGFGTKLLDNAPDNIRNCIYYLVVREVASVLYDSSKQCACIWDEFEKVALNGYTLPMVSDLVRMVRKYHSIMILGMQEPSDLATDIVIRGATARSYGTAILNNCTYKIVMKLEDKAIGDLAELIRLSDSDIDRITDLVTGRAVFFRNKNHYLIDIYANQHDIDALKVE